MRPSGKPWHPDNEGPPGPRQRTGWSREARRVSGAGVGGADQGAGDGLVDGATDGRAVGWAVGIGPLPGGNTSGIGRP